MNEILLTDAIIADDQPHVAGFGWIDRGSLHVRAGLIAGIFDHSIEPDTISKTARVIPLGGKVIMPALVNGHTHLSQTFMRGLASGRPLLRWLKELIWPLQGAFSAELLELAALLGLAENTRSGVAHVVNHHKVAHHPEFTHAVFRAARQSGLRVTIARAWADRGTNAETPESILADLESFFSLVQSEQKLSYASGPLTPWRCSAETLLKTHHLALQHGSFSHIHLSETQEEVHMTVEETGLRPAAWLADLGLLDDRFQIVHAVWVDEEEIRLLAEAGSPVIHCPVSNAVLGSGIAPLALMQAHGAKLYLGTDGPASNDTQDSFETMKMALCLSRAAQREANAISPQQALQMATRSTGLAVGQQADLAIIDIHSLWSSPVHDIDSALVLSCRASNVWGLLVGGEFMLYDGQLTQFDEELLIKESESAIKILRRKAGLEQ